VPVAKAAAIEVNIDRAAIAIGGQRVMIVIAGREIFMNIVMGNQEDRKEVEDGDFTTAISMGVNPIRM
jgi:hypothetical protein